MFIKIIMNDNKIYTIEDLYFENKLTDIIDLLNLIEKTNYKYTDIIYLELKNCSNIRCIPKSFKNLQIIKIFNCKYIKNIPKFKNLKQIEFIKPKIFKVNHKLIK